jgi:putative membrane protein
MTSNLRRRLAVTLIFAAAVSAAGIDIAIAQNASVLAAVSSAPIPLSPVDYNFVAQANLGAPFQVDSGRLAEEKATNAAIRDYARLMVVSHVHHKGITAPPNTLLHAAYDTMITSLKIERDAAFDRDYVDGQVEYQKGNTALFQGEIENGTDPELKAFARQTLPKIQDHLQRALKLAEHAKPGTTAE